MVALAEVINFPVSTPYSLYASAGTFSKSRASNVANGPQKQRKRTSGEAGRRNRERPANVYSDDHLAKTRLAAILRTGAPSLASPSSAPARLSLRPQSCYAGTGLQPV